MYLKTYLSNTPNTVDQIQIQIQIHGLKFDQIQIQIQIRRICICICICKYKYVFDPSPVPTCSSFCLMFVQSICNVRTNTLAMGCCLGVRPTRNRVVLCSSHLHKCVQVRPIITNLGPRFIQHIFLNFIFILWDHVRSNDVIFTVVRDTQAISDHLY